jgi:predicted  nucleic acid-binding Zn-ribbon protein
MDDRKKRIDELEKNKRESRFSLDSLLEGFGENLYGRIEDSAEFEDVLKYNTLQKDIADSTAAIFTVEEQERRFKELEDTIKLKEQEEKERGKELTEALGKLGKAMLENEAYNEFTSVFKEQADALATRVGSLENRISELENKNGGNVFSWIGKSAHGLVLKTFLSKAQESQEQLYRSIGERYKRNDGTTQATTGGEDGEVAIYCEEIEKLRGVSDATADELSKLRDEKRILSASFGVEGSPQKQVQALKNRIASVKDDLRSLYRNFGAQAAGIMDAEISPQRKYFIDTLVTAEDGENIGRAVKLNQSIVNSEKEIAKLQASLSIDEENVKIEKYRKQIDEKRGRITDLEKSISDIGESIKDCEAYIKELQKML